MLPLHYSMRVTGGRLQNGGFSLVLDYAGVSFYYDFY